MGIVLHKLNLTDAQKTQVKSIMASEKSQFQALRTSSQTNREALASTPPTDTAAYAALIATAQKNAATRIQLESETWSNVYSNVLTQTQRDAIPGIVAAAKAQRESGWRSGRRSTQADRLERRVKPGLTLGSVDPVFLEKLDTLSGPTR